MNLPEGGCFMKINLLGIRAIQSYNQAQTVKNVGKKGESFADKLEISSKAKEMQVSSTYQSDRAEKVNQITQEFINGKKCIVIPVEENEQTYVNGMTDIL